MQRQGSCKQLPSKGRDVAQARWLRYLAAVARKGRIGVSPVLLPGGHKA
jgi:hypothetical protein